jgi:beta-lactamase class A
VIKLPIMVEAFRQALVWRINFEQTVVMREYDRVGGSGILGLLSPGWRSASGICCASRSASAITRRQTC